MTLGQKQRQLPVMLIELLEFAYKNGYEITLGDAYRDPRLHGDIGTKKGYGHSKSAHKQRLAIDLNLFKDGKYLTSSDAHKPLGEFWESLGGAWGGRFGDGNHYSIEHNGIK
ncbi:MAG: M15 family metallopeptidase [Pseudomonadota bacterium]